MERCLYYTLLPRIPIFIYRATNWGTGTQSPRSEIAIFWLFCDFEDFAARIEPPITHLQAHFIDFQQNWPKKP